MKRQCIRGYVDKRRLNRRARNDVNLQGSVKERRQRMRGSPDQQKGNPCEALDSCFGSPDEVGRSDEKQVPLNQRHRSTLKFEGPS